MQADSPHDAVINKAVELRESYEIDRTSQRADDVTSERRPRMDRLAVDAEELAEMLSVSPSTIRRMDASGKLPKAVTIGQRSVRWQTDAIRAWLRMGCPSRKSFESEWSEGRN